jgi:hypothetical protein
MANIKISDLRPVEADLPVVSLTDKELSVVSGGKSFWDTWVEGWTRPFW